MSSPLTMFLAHSFAPQKVNSAGEVDQNGISDMQIADEVAKWIGELSHGQIQVIRTRDPHGDYISSQVRKDIASADLVLCLFTKRTKDNFRNHWVTSSYVVSEASAALMQFPCELETHSRLFGLLEEGVDPEQLGMAFHRNKTAKSFRRDRLDDLKLVVQSIIESIRTTKVVARADREYLALDKTIWIFRNGSVLVECRHRFRFTTEITTARIPHTMWRISQHLPDISELLNGNPPSLTTGAFNGSTGFLRCYLISSGHQANHGGRFRVISKPSCNVPNERNFDVEVTGMALEPSDELTYEIAWGYPKAFAPPKSLTTFPNSVGLRTGERGMTHAASITLKFQRVFDHGVIEPDRILEEKPSVFITDTSLLPASQSAEQFWHSSSAWSQIGSLSPCPKYSSAMFEVYRWNADCFRGMAKVTWNAHLNYFHDEPTDVAQVQNTGVIRLPNPVRSN